MRAKLNTWKLCGNTSGAVHDFTVLVLLYVTHNNCVPTEDGKWTDINVTSGPGPLSNATLNTIGNKLYLFGGLNREIGWNNDLWCYDTGTSIQ